MTAPLVIFGHHDTATVAQMETCLATGSAATGVLCADGHLGYNHPIGGVVGYEDHVSISGVGYDIACGNKAVRLDMRASEIEPRVDTILQDIARNVSFGLGRANAARVEHPLFESDLWQAAGVADLKGMAQGQLGTVGGGNHYVDLFRDDEGWVWIGVHFGSRGLGHRITTKYLQAASASGDMLAPPALLSTDTAAGQGYLAGIELGGLYAYAGRDWVTERVRRLIGGTVTDEVHNHHNYVWRERHGDRDLWVVRKGATPAFPGQRGFVGGSMGDDAVILRGVESPRSRTALYSTVHGAGRVMSRSEAKGKRDRKSGRVIRPPAVDADEMRAWLSRKGVRVLGGDLDEAPQAYRRLPEVLAEHAGTVEIERVLHPMGVVMAGPGDVDPYKD
ncbi:RtcB family protein [Rubellimicrobium roseum]|uniref:3'-phosphate/5'-hydroxy nucleic acid ligase n=1 Tax=Rubellimicrobium roseum TaxID=687525 RepID=A0A5C4NE80_9RHOB|nr:RtcB family protein [Rubellimicrobium roseum]TNC72943.1 RtcB family protein [Rubellimicrobium roseum]